METIDLHVHTTASDGTQTPSDVVRLAASLGLRAVAITDHDTVSGCAEARRAAEGLGVEVVPGIEISTKYRSAVHILGYYVDTASPSLAAVLDWEVRDRDARNRRICALMAADGLPVSYEQMRERFGEVVGRPHFAQLLCEFGLASSVSDAFARYVGRGMKYYLPRNMLSLEQSIGTILSSGGVPVLAHPFQYKLDDAGLRDLIERCLSLGLRGMECRYSGYDAAQTSYLESLAGEYSLIKTGGSDYHGSTKPHIALGRGHGRLRVPYAWLAPLRAAAAQSGGAFPPSAKASSSNPCR